VLRAVESRAVEAALEEAERGAHERDDEGRALALELEQARYATRLAEKRYEAVDPEKRLVAAELEARWNAALEQVRELEGRLKELESRAAEIVPADRTTLLRLAEDLPSAWSDPLTDMRLKQRIVRIVINEIVADVDPHSHEIVLMIHWAGGRHSDLRVRKNRVGQHRYCTEADAVDVVRKMAGRFSDEQIATTLNMQGKKTGAGNTWNEVRVRSLRCKLRLPNFNAAQRQGMLTLEEAATRLSVSASTVRKLIAMGILEAQQVIAYAPWEIPEARIEQAAVRAAARAMRERRFKPRCGNGNDQTPRLPGL